MDDHATRTQKIDTPLLAVLEYPGALDENYRCSIAIHGRSHCWATLSDGPSKDAHSKERGRIELGSQKLSLEHLPNYGIKDRFLQYFNHHHRQMVWSLDDQVITTIRDTTCQPTDLSGVFEIADRRYIVERSCNRSRGDQSSPPGRILMENRDLAHIIFDEEAPDRLWISPSEPTRIDTLIIGFHLFKWLLVNKHARGPLVPPGSLDGSGFG